MKVAGRVVVKESNQGVANLLVVADLLVVVFAPEDVQSSSRPYPLPREKRILYLSAVPRTAAGAEEAFVIRLLQEQIDQFGISQPNSTPTRDVSVERQPSLVNRRACLTESPADQCVASSRC